jgi:AcrR family transcriptional regulator
MFRRKFGYGPGMSKAPRGEPAARRRRRRRGRRPGANKTREVILDAARTRFARSGYTGATIRKIADDARVDASLVMQFYGTKEELFAAVMSITPGALSRFGDAFEGPKQSLGERVTRAFFGVWEGDPQDAEPMLAMLRAAVSNEQATAQLRGFLQARLVAALGAENAVRVGIASSMLVGVVVGRRILQLPALAKQETETLVALIAPGLQAILTAPPRPPGRRRR